jgi:hypothetical protein
LKLADEIQMTTDRAGDHFVTGYMVAGCFWAAFVVYLRYRSERAEGDKHPLMSVFLRGVGRPARRTDAAKRYDNAAVWVTLLGPFLLLAVFVLIDRL